jgi:hypothetical protein
MSVHCRYTGVHRLKLLNYAQKRCIFGGVHASQSGIRPIGSNRAARSRGSVTRVLLGNANERSAGTNTSGAFGQTLSTINLDSITDRT